MNCNDCHTCKDSCPNQKCGCLMCGKKGMEVPFDTVLALTNPIIRNTLIEDNYYLCTNPQCQVAYYSLNGRAIKLNEISTDVWFKKDKKKYIVCYCRDISLQDIIHAVNDLEITTIVKVVHYLKKDNLEVDCIHHNPTGVTCEKLFINAIEFAKKIKNRRAK